MEDDNQLPLELLEELYNSRKEIKELYKMEEIYWRRRYREKWIKDGDVNTSFLHKVANMQRQVNIIRQC